MDRRSVLKAAGASMALPLMGGASWAAPNWPRRNLTFVVTTAAGDGTDLGSRAMAKFFEKQLKVPVIVKNVVGGAGAIGAAEVANAKPDGYTILMTMSPSCAVFLPLTTDLPFQPFKAFDFLAQLWGARYGLAVPASSPVMTVEDLIARSKERPITYSQFTLTQGIAMYQLAKQTGAQFRPVATNSVPESVLQVAGGHVDATVSSIGDLQPLIDGGKIRLLASTFDKRLEEYPEVKTLIEMGYNAKAIAPVSAAVPTGTPPEIVARLKELFRDAAADPEIIEYHKKTKYNLQYASGEDVKLAYQALSASVEPVLRELGQLKK